MEENLMLLVAHAQTGTTHAALDGYNVSLCGLLTFGGEDADNVFKFSKERTNCRRCRSLLDCVRDEVVPPVGEGEIYVTQDVVRRLMGTSTVQSKHTHYSLDGEKSLCGVVINNTPVKLIGKTHPDRPTCLRCLASPKVEEALRTDEAIERFKNRGTYDRKAYGHTK
jgi:hypothetical protein